MSPTDSMDPAATSVLEALKGLNSGYVDAFWKVIGFQLLTIGWILTSSEARKFLHQSWAASAIFLIVVVVCLLGHSAIVFRMYRRSRSLVQWLAERQAFHAAAAVYELALARVAAKYSAVLILF